LNKNSKNNFNYGIENHGVRTKNKNKNNFFEKDYFLFFLFFLSFVSTRFVWMFRINSNNDNTTSIKMENINDDNLLQKMDEKMPEKTENNIQFFFYIFCMILQSVIFASVFYLMKRIVLKPKKVRTGGLERTMNPAPKNENEKMIKNENKTEINAFENSSKEFDVNTIIFRYSYMSMIFYFIGRFLTIIYWTIFHFQNNKKNILRNLPEIISKNVLFDYFLSLKFHILIPRSIVSINIFNLIISFVIYVYFNKYFNNGNSLVNHNNRNNDNNDNYNDNNNDNDIIESDICNTNNNNIGVKYSDDDYDLCNNSDNNNENNDNDGDNNNININNNNNNNDDEKTQCDNNDNTYNNIEMKIKNKNIKKIKNNDKNNDTHNNKKIINPNECINLQLCFSICCNIHSMYGLCLGPLGGPVVLGVMIHLICSFICYHHDYIYDNNNNNNDNNNNNNYNDNTNTINNFKSSSLQFVSYIIHIGMLARFLFFASGHKYDFGTLQVKIHIIHVYTHIYVQIIICIYIHISMCIKVYLSICKYIYSFMYTYTYIYKCQYDDMILVSCKYIYIYG
jgi:hypothetical protein